MWYRTIYKIFTGSWILASFIVTASTAVADGSVMPAYPDQSMQYVAEQSNPWLLPEKPKGSPDFKKFPNYHSEQNQSDRTGSQTQGHRFVTPEILESLRQQQKQNQMMRDNLQNQQYMPRRPAQSGYGYPSAGARYSYDTPALSPWAGGADTLYRGQSFPWVPNEAIGGISPIPMPSFGDNSLLVEPDNTEEKNKNNVFNPFSFIEDGNF